MAGSQPTPRARRPKVSTYYRESRGTWSVRYWEHGRRLEETGYETEDEAEDRADEIRQRLRQGLSGARTPRTIGELIAHWWDTYVTTGSVTRSGRETYQIDAARILATIGLEQAAQPTARFRLWLDELAQSHSPRTANKTLTALSSAYQRALEHDPPLVETNPCRGVKRLPEQVQPMVIPTPRQVVWLERTAPSERAYCLLMIASRCGPRQSELFALEWGHDLGDALHFGQVAERGREIRKSTKTRHSRRVPIPPSVREALDWYANTIPRRRGMLFPSPTDPQRPADRSAWVKVYWYPWRRHAAWHAAAAGEGEHVWGGLLELHWKHLRHHYASRLASARATILQCSRWMGHSSFATTDKRYSFLFDEDEAHVMAAID